jgi:hypothetical protein
MFGIYLNHVIIEYRVPLVTGNISCGYIKFDGNNTAAPLGAFTEISRSKKANSPPS